MNYLYLSLTAIPVLGILDYLWIGVIAKSFYKAQLGPLLSDHPVWIAAALFYILYACALAYFVMVPAIAERSLWQAILAGLFLGLVAFGTYDLTNQATVPGWKPLMTVVDMAWGAFAGGATSAIVYLIATCWYGF